MRVSGAALLLVTIASLCFVEQYGWCGSRSRQPPSFSLRKYRLSHLKKLKLENRDGISSGKVRDVVLDLGSGQVPYALVASGGVLGLGRKSTVVPASLLSLNTAKAGILALEMGQSRWRNAPQFHKRDLARLRSGFTQGIDSYYAALMPVTHHSPRAGAQVASATGAPAGRPPHSSSFQLASDVIGKDVFTRQNEPVGEVSDLLIDLSGQKPAYALISAGRLLKRDILFAVPLRSLGLADNDKIEVDANLRLFEQAQPFTEKIWEQGPASGGIYRYDDGPVDNTARNARDEQPDALTPFSQSETRTDLRTTQHIRRALARDRSLSLTAKNIKIITINGRVTLRGPVRTSYEADRIDQLARQVAGAKNVEDQLETERK